jgi:hypothetical protein
MGTLDACGPSSELFGEGVEIGGGHVVEADCETVMVCPYGRQNRKVSDKTRR